MKQLLIFLILSLLIFSCVPDRVRIRSEKRVSVTGKVVSVNNGGIQGIPVISSGALGGNVSGSPYQILGMGRTSDSGDFNFVSLDTYNSDFSVSINAENEEFHNEDYASIHYVDQEDDHGIFLTLGRVVLPKKIDFHFSVENVSDTQEEVFFTITYSKQGLYYQIVGGRVTEEVPDNYYFQNFQTLRHNLNSGNFTEVIPTLEGTELIFTYTRGEEEPREIIITVTPETDGYVFEI